MVTYTDIHSKAERIQALCDKWSKALDYRNRAKSLLFTVKEGLTKGTVSIISKDSSYTNVLDYFGIDFGSLDDYDVAHPKQRKDIESILENYILTDKEIQDKMYPTMHTLIEEFKDDIANILVEKKKEVRVWLAKVSDCGDARCIPHLLNKRKHDLPTSDLSFVNIFASSKNLVNYVESNLGRMIVDARNISFFPIPESIKDFSVKNIKTLDKTLLTLDKFILYAKTYLECSNRA